MTELRASFAAQCEKTTERAAEAAPLREHLRVQTAAMAEDLAAVRTEATSLRAEVERLRALLAGRADGHSRAVSDLAAATQLLELWLLKYPTGVCAPDTRAYLTNAPAAPTRTEPVYGSSPVGGTNLRPEHRPSIGELLAAPTRTECKYVGRCNSSRCEACSSPTSTARSGLVYDACSRSVYDAERAVLRIVRQDCKDSRTWMQANMPRLWAANDALKRAEEDT